LSRTSTESVSDAARLAGEDADALDDSPLHWRARVKAVDLALYKRMRRLGHTPETVAVVRRYSRLGEHGAVWLAAGATAALLDKPRRRQWLRATATVGAAHATSTSIKLAIGRRRPAVEDLPHLMSTPTGLSFPSSHATSSFAAARAFGALVPGPPLQLAAVAMGLSRLYLGVHYPSDVAAGAALGTLLGSLGR
jgi:membrane-associated phospholipid phosphatase